MRASRRNSKRRLGNERARARKRKPASCSVLCALRSVGAGASEHKNVSVAKPLSDRVSDCVGTSGHALPFDARARNGVGYAALATASERRRSRLRAHTPARAAHAQVSSPEPTRSTDRALRSIVRNYGYNNLS